MGVWRFFSLRKKDYEKELDELEGKIQSTETNLALYRDNQRSISSRWVVLSLILYLIAAAAAYLHPTFPASPLERAICLAFLLAGPLLIYFINKLLIAFFRHKIKSTEKILQVLKADQASKMEEVKKNASYYEAKKILDRFETPKKAEENGVPRLRQVQNTPGNRPGAPANPQGPNLAGPMTPGFHPATPGQPFQRPAQPMTPMSLPQQPQQPQQFQSPQQPRPHPQPSPAFQQPVYAFPAPIVYQPEKPSTWIDKIVDYAVGGSEAVEMLSKLQKENEQLKQRLMQKHEEVVQLKARMEPGQDRAPENFPSTPTPFRRLSSEERWEQEEQPAEASEGAQAPLAEEPRQEEPRQEEQEGAGEPDADIRRNVLAD